MTYEPDGGILVIANEAAGGRGGDVAGQIRSALAGASLEARIDTCAPGGLESRLQAERDDGASVVGVAGGDGTMRTAAQLLAHSRSVLAAFPAGTLNNFAHRMGLHSFDDAAAAIAAGRHRTVAVGRVDGDAFLNTATFGLYADVLRRRERLRRWLGKWPAAGLSFIITIVRLRPVHLTLEVDGASLARDTALVWIGIGYGSFPVVHQSAERRATPDLEVAVLRDISRAGMFAFGARTFWRALRRGAPVRDPALEVLHVRRLSVESRHGPMGVTLDGEVVPRRSAASVRVEDDALRVVVGEEAQAPPAPRGQSPVVNRRATVK
jgi:undecaprenyl-diphosphatase